MQRALKVAIYLMVSATTIVTLSAACESARSLFCNSLSLPVPNLESLQKESPPEPSGHQPVLVYSVESKTFRHTTAYTPGDSKQTDSDPCISADGTDICKDLSRGEKICAANFVPIGTRLFIEGFGICTVKDRLHRRYKNRVDLAMNLKDRDDALRWGKKNTEVQILK